MKDGSVLPSFLILGHFGGKHRFAIRAQDPVFSWVARVMDNDPAAAVGAPVEILVFLRNGSPCIELPHLGAIRVMVLKTLGGQCHAASPIWSKGAKEERRPLASCIFPSNLRPPLFLCPYLMLWQLPSLRSDRRTPSRPRKSSAFPSLTQAPEPTCLKKKSTPQSGRSRHGFHAPTPGCMGLDRGPDSPPDDRPVEMLPVASSSESWRVRTPPRSGSMLRKRTAAGTFSRTGRALFGALLVFGCWCLPRHSAKAHSGRLETGLYRLHGEYKPTPVSRGSARNSSIALWSLRQNLVGVLLGKAMTAQISAISENFSGSAKTSDMLLDEDEVPASSS